MTTIDELLLQIPMSQVAAQLGVDEATAEQATRAALPALVQGMQANAQDAARARALVNAIGKHAKTAGAGPTPADLSSVDTIDGDKIVAHVFGDTSDAVADKLGSLGGGADLFKKLLPLLAPLVMGFLAKQVVGRGSSSGSAAAATGAATSGGNEADSGGGGIDDLLGGLLGGGSGGGIGDLLGGLLGGGGSSGDGIGDLLGGLLGGGSK